MKHLQWITDQMNKGKTWDDLKNISEDEWLWEQLVPCGTIAFKILLNDENWSEGEDLVVSAGDTVICRPSFQ